MYYFKVPVFTKLSRIHNIILLTLQLIILTISITISLYRGCSYQSTEFVNGCKPFDILPGNTMITNRSYTVWQYLKPKKYSSELIKELYDIKYYNKVNTTFNGYLLFTGNIMIFDINTQNYVAIFKDFSDQLYYSEFISYFNQNVDMNKEIYKVAIKNGILELLFLKNCSNVSVLFEKDEKCYFKNDTNNAINNFISDYFNQKFIVPYSCSNCYMKRINTLDEFITVLTKCISIFLMFNSLLIIIYLFIVSKIKKHDVGYINEFINEDINICENIEIEKKR